jgi:hypothetical protein
MNSDADYSYNDPSPVSYSSGTSLQLPFAILSSAIMILLIGQTMAVFKQKSALQEGRVQLADAYTKREVLVKQSGELQNKLQALVMDLLILSKTDDDAKAIVGKYNIQQNAPQTPATPEK